MTSFDNWAGRTSENHFHVCHKSTPIHGVLIPYFCNTLLDFQFDLALRSTKHLEAGEGLLDQSKLQYSSMEQESKHNKLSIVKTVMNDNDISPMQVSKSKLRCLEMIALRTKKTRRILQEVSALTSITTFCYQEN